MLRGTSALSYESSCIHFHSIWSTNPVTPGPTAFVDEVYGHVGMLTIAPSRVRPHDTYQAKEFRDGYYTYLRAISASLD